MLFVFVYLLVNGKLVVQILNEPDLIVHIYIQTHTTKYVYA